MSSRGSYRSVYSALPDDPDFQRLTPHARLVLYTARLCRDAGPSAIFRYYAGTLMAQTGLTAKQLEGAMAELHVGRWIEYDTNVLWVRNGLRYDPAMTLANPNHRRAIEKHLEELPRSPVVIKFCDYYKIANPLADHPPSHPDPIPDQGKGKGIGKGIGKHPCEADASPATGILQWLNTKAGKAFRPSEVNLAFIRARLADGIQDWQLRAIVSRKVREWAGTEQAKYLRPATLFNKTKCEQYLGELPAASNGQPD